MKESDGEKRYTIPESIRTHLSAAHDNAVDGDALYHIREAIQIADSEVGTPAEAEIDRPE